MSAALRAVLAIRLAWLSSGVPRAPPCSLGARERFVAGDSDNDLAGGASLFDQSDGFCGRGEWVGPVDDRRELGGLDGLCYLLDGFGCLVCGERLQGLPDEAIENSGFGDVAE